MERMNPQDIPTLSLADSVLPELLLVSGAFVSGSRTEHANSILTNITPLLLTPQN
jgi:hypothetical protein